MDAKKAGAIVFSLLIIVSGIGCSSDKKTSSDNPKSSVVTVKKIPIDDAPSKEIGMMTSAKDAIMELDKNVKPDAAKFVVEIIEDKLQYGKIKKVTFAGLPYFDKNAGSHELGMQEFKGAFGALLGKRRGESYKPELIINRNNNRSVFLIETDKYQDLLVEIKRDQSEGTVKYYGQELYREEGLIFKDVHKADISKFYMSRNERRKFYEQAISDATNKFSNFNISDCLDYELSLYPNVIRVGSNVVVVFATYPEEAPKHSGKSFVYDEFQLIYDTSGNLLEAKQTANGRSNSSVTTKQTNISNTNNDVTGSTGTGSDVRGSALFLGTWKQIKGGNTITIKEANPQSGNYFIELSFYRLASAEGHANIDGNKLIINKGNINGKNFRGTIEKTNNGIRLNVTESGYEYIKPGSVYEYQRKQ